MAAPGYLDLPGSADDATQIPCAFDFTSGLATSSAGEIPLTVTRAGTATRVNGQGLVEVVAANTLRIDYDPVTFACKGALIEEARTNECTYSAAIDNATWIKTNASVTANSGAAPDGTNSAFLVTTTGVANPNIYNGPNAAAAVVYTGSIWLKAGNVSTVVLQLYQNGFGGFASLNLTILSGPGSITGQGGGSPAVTGLSTSQWTRVAVTPTVAANNTAGIQLYIKPNAAAPVIGDTLYAWGAQLEQGAFATSYIPTTSAAVTRNADVVSGASLGSWYNTTEGTAFVEFRRDADSFPVRLWQFNRNDGGSYVDLILLSSGNYQSLPTGGSLAGANNVGAVHRAAMTLKTNDFALSVDGSAVAAFGAGALATDQNRFQLGNSSGSAQFLNGWLRKFAYIPKRLANASLQSISLNGLATKQYTQSLIRARPRLAAPKIPDGIHPGLRQFLIHLKELFEVRNAEVGSPLDANPTYRDLISTGLIKISDNVPLLAAGREFDLNTKTWLTSNIPQWLTDNTIPPSPTGLIVTANTAGLTITWDAPTFTNYKQTLIYRAASNNLSSAVLIGSNTGNTYVDDLPASGTAYYYWIKHQSKSELSSNYNSTNGTTVGNVASAPTLSFAFAGENLVLSWTTPTSNLAIQYYEVSYGATPGANPVGVTQANTLRVRVDYGGTRQYWVRAIDINFGLGTGGTTTVTVASPSTPSLGQTLTGGSLVLNVTAGAPGSLPIAYYDLRYGASWAAGTPMGISLSTRYEINVNWTGARTFYAVAVDTAGNQSSSGSVTFTPALPAALALTAQVIDNNVLLRWTATQGSLPIDHYNVYRDTTLIGTDYALFAAVFESVAGTYVYKVEPVDAAGNIGSVSTTTAVVAAPPDFVLYSSLNSAFGGTKTTCFKDVDTGDLFANVDATETWQSHFTSRSWNTPQDQINAGYSRYLVGKTTGSYLEKVDYSATIPSTKITMSPTTAFSQGTVTQTPTLATSPDDITYTTYAGVWSVFATAFRYVKYKIDFAATHDGTGLATDTSNLIGIKPLTFTLDVKLKTKEGVVTANSGDAGGTSVDITGMFIDVSSILLTPLSTTAKHPTYDFVDAPNPTSFKVLLWNDTGARVSGDVSWVVRGV